MKRTTTILLILVAGLTATAYAQEGPIRVIYDGELIGPSYMPLAGVFDLEFALYGDMESTEPLWSERHFVSAVEGGYRVILGTDTDIEPAVADREAFLAVVFNESELFREPMTLRDLQRVQEAGETSDLSADQVELWTFAHFADRAVIAAEADHAQDADRLGGRTADEIDRFDEAMGALEDHMRDENAHGGGGRVRIGGRTTVLQPVGGEGGAPFTRMCPPGQVVIGMRGRHGGMVDGFEIVCAPLE